MDIRYFEHFKRKEEENKRKEFITHLENATKIVKSWPKWKQDIANQIFQPNKN